MFTNCRLLFWPVYSGDYSGQRHSPLKQITPDNVHRLMALWTFQTGVIPRRGLEGTPLVVDNVMYMPGPFNNAWALDARITSSLPPEGRRQWELLRQAISGMMFGRDLRTQVEPSPPQWKGWR